MKCVVKLILRGIFHSILQLQSCLGCFSPTIKQKFNYRNFCFEWKETRSQSMSIVELNEKKTRHRHTHNNNRITIKCSFTSLIHKMCLNVCVCMCEQLDSCIYFLILLFSFKPNQFRSSITLPHSTLYICNA